MKILTLILTFVVAFSITTMAVSAVPPGLMDGAPPEDNISSKINTDICLALSVNSVKIMMAKREGITRENVKNQLQSDADAAGSALSEPDIVVIELTKSIIDTLYDSDINMTNDEEIVEIGTNIYNNCIEYANKTFFWKTEDGI